jgi:flagellar basal body-associated protein FliL
MPGAVTADKSVKITITLLIGALVIGFAAIGLWWQSGRAATPSVSYLLIGPLVVSDARFSLKASLAIQINTDHADWAKQHQAALRQQIETALLALEPEQVRAPGGLQALQTQLNNTLARQPGNQNVEQILLTDFILQTDV